MRFNPLEDYSRLYAFDNSFIHFLHLRSGDREGMYDMDLSLGKTDSGWLLTCERKMSREQVDGYVYDFSIEDIILPEDFFEKYSKKEFIKIVSVISSGERQYTSKIPSQIKFRSRGIYTEWSEYPGIRELEKKDYIVSSESYSICIPRKSIPSINSICDDLKIDLIRTGIYFDFFFAAWKDSIGIITHGEKYFLYKISDEIELYGEYNVAELKQCLAHMLNVKNVQINEKVLNKKRIFKGEKEAKDFLDK